MAFGTIGTGINTPTAALTATMNAITEKFIYPVVADNVFLPSILFWAMQRQGQKVRHGRIDLSGDVDGEPERRRVLRH